MRYPVRFVELGATGLLSIFRRSAAGRWHYRFKPWPLDEEPTLEAELVLPDSDKAKTSLMSFYPVVPRHRTRPPMKTCLVINEIKPQLVRHGRNWSKLEL